MHIDIGFWTANIYHADAFSENVMPIFTSFQGLLDCTIKDEVPLAEAENNSLDVQNLTAYFKLCCKDSRPCTLCLVTDILPDIDMEDEGHSGLDEEDSSAETINPKGINKGCMQPTVMLLLVIERTIPVVQ